MDTPFYAEFSTRSNFSFLEGASHPEELAVTAMRLGHGALGLADRNTVAGVVRAHMAAKEAKLAYHPGARLVFSDGTPDVLTYPRDRAAWGHLCRLLTTGNLRGEKGAADLRLEDLLEWGEGPQSCPCHGRNRRQSRTKMSQHAARTGAGAACRLWQICAPRRRPALWRQRPALA